MSAENPAWRCWGDILVDCHTISEAKRAIAKLTPAEIAAVERAEAFYEETATKVAAWGFTLPWLEQRMIPGVGFGEQDQEPVCDTANPTVEIPGQFFR